MKRSIIFFNILFILFACSKIAIAEQIDQSLEIQELIEEAVNNNPRLKSFEESVSARREKPSQVQSLDNPRLKLSIMNLPTDTFDFDQEAMTQKQVSIMQKFPFPGKLDLKGKIAEKAIDMAAEDYIEQKNMLIMQVKTAYAQILFLDLATEITEENRKLLREFVKIVETKYEVGSGIQQDVIKAQVELSKMTDRFIPIKQKRETMVAMLNTLLNRPVQTPFTANNRIQMTDLKLSIEDLKKIADENRPVLQKKKHLIERNKTVVRLSRKNYYPDLDIGVSYGQRDDAPTQERADFLSGFVTIQLPLWYKEKESRKVEEDLANVRRAQEEYRSLQNNVYFQINKLMSEIDSHVQRIELFQSGLIPQSRLSLDSALSAYKVNKVNFLTLINNQITLYNFELKYNQVITDHEIKLAELESVIGQRISGSWK
jgi:outer membrane protein TolC